MMISCPVLRSVYNPLEQCIILNNVVFVHIVADAMVSIFQQNIELPPQSLNHKQKFRTSMDMFVAFILLESFTVDFNGKNEISSFTNRLLLQRPAKFRQSFHGLKYVPAL
jgi:hypothetical protein